MCVSASLRIRLAQALGRYGATVYLRPTCEEYNDVDDDDEYDDDNEDEEDGNMDEERPHASR